MRSEICNARITGTILGIEDHGIFTGFVYCEGNSWGCGFGGMTLDNWSEADGRRIGTAFGMEWIRAVLKVVGVEKWEDLEGKHVRVDTEGPGGGIKRIGNFIKDEWFDPKELAAKHFPDKDK